MLDANAGDLVRRRRNISRPAWRIAGRLETRPADALVPQHRDTAIGERGQSVAGAMQIDRAKILVLIETEPRSAYSATG